MQYLYGTFGRMLVTYGLGSLRNAQMLSTARSVLSTILGLRLHMSGYVCMSALGSAPSGRTVKPRTLPHIAALSAGKLELTLRNSPRFVTTIGSQKAVA